MNRDAIALTGVVLSLVLLLVVTHPVWLLTLGLSGLYFGWRIGQRLIPAETNGQGV